MADLYVNGDQRYWAKRNAGISSTRKDGSKYSPETDKQAAAAEKFAADFMGCKFNAEINSTKGDAGFDFIFELEVEVYWPENPRAKYLIIPIDDPKRWADIYVVVTGSIDNGFSIAGWTTHKKLVQHPTKDFGYGMRYCVEFEQLLSIDRLLGLKIKRND